MLPNIFITFQFPFLQFNFIFKQFWDKFEVRFLFPNYLINNPIIMPLSIFFFIYLYWLEANYFTVL